MGFDFQKFVREKTLLKENIGGYADIKPLKEVEYTGRNPWITPDEVDEYDTGDWYARLDSQTGAIYWTPQDPNYGGIYVYATPAYDNAPGTPVEVFVGDNSVIQTQLDDGDFNNMEEYVNAISPFLKTINDRMTSGEWDEWLDKEEDPKAGDQLSLGMNEEDGEDYTDHVRTDEADFGTFIDKLVDTGKAAVGLSELDGDEDIEDLFQTPELIPANVQAILDQYADELESGDYRDLEIVNNELNKVGYEFDYYLDGVPYNLRKIDQMPDEDDMSEGYGPDEDTASEELDWSKLK